MGKTVTASKFSEWKGLDRIGPIVHSMPSIFREISKDDFGIDGEIEIIVSKASGEGFETTGGIIKVQSKSEASYIKQDSEQSFSTPVERNDLEARRSHVGIGPELGYRRRVRATGGSALVQRGEQGT